MRFILLFCLCAVLTLARGQHYNFVSYSVKDGLAQSQVRDICQDEHGYLWIATGSGLSRFNGMEFVNYSIDDGLPDNAISNLYVCQKGNLWVSTSKGIAKFEDQEILTYYFKEEYRINDIAELKGEIYFASNTGLIAINEGQFEQLGDSSAQGHYFRSIVNYKDSVLICGSKTGIYTWDGSNFNRLDVPGYETLNIRNLTIRGNELYVTARRIGLFSYDLLKEEITTFNLDYTTTLSLDFYEEGIFGISTNAGAFLINQGDTLYFNNRNGLMRSGLECLFKDSEGNIWMGTDGRGLLKFSGISVVSYTTEDDLGSDLVLSIAQDSSGQFIFGTYDAGITQFRSNGVNQFNARNSEVMDNTVWTIMLDSLNQTWLGTSRGLTILDENNQPVDHALKGSPKIRSMLRVEEGYVLMGGDEGLIIMKKDTVLYVDSLNINKLHAIGDRVYCAASNGLFVFSAKDDYQKLSQINLTENKVFTLTSDFRNNLWIGTENGLFVMLPNGVIRRIELDERDYKTKNILGLTTSRDSSIWVSGMKGVFQLKYAPKRENNYEVFNYGIAEGLIDEECNVNAIYEDFENNIWVGTASGLARIDPSLNNKLFHYEVPTLHFTGLRLFMEKFDYSLYNAELDSVFSVPVSIELPHNKNHLTFDFIGVSLKDPESVRYEYRLIGVNEEWSPVSKSNYATYSFLQPGSYTFQVRAMNKNKLWSTIREINVLITPPFWKSWWFIALVVIAIALIIVFIFRARIRTLKQKQDNEKLELKNRLLFLEQRSLNASMNRHFIFNSLNSIQYFINGSDKLSANRFLSNFAKLIRKNLDSSAANNFIVTLQEEIERIELYLSLEKMRFSDKFEYTVDVSSSLDTESIEIPSMILQQFVENSIIHGVLSLEDRKGEISVKIFQEFGEVVFEVTDNGLGIDNSLKSKQNSISGDHESKGVEITNRRIELLRRLTGENLLIVGPFQMNDNDGNSLGTKVVLKLGGADKFQ